MFLCVQHWSLKLGFVSQAGALYLSYRLHPTFILIINNSDNCTQNGKQQEHLKYAWQRWNFTGLPVFCSLGDYFTPNFGLLGHWLSPNLWLLLFLCNLQTLRFWILYISPFNHRKSKHFHYITHFSLKFCFCVANKRENTLLLPAAIFKGNIPNIRMLTVSKIWTIKSLETVLERWLSTWKQIYPKGPKFGFPAPMSEGSQL